MRISRGGTVRQCSKHSINSKLECAQWASSCDFRFEGDVYRFDDRRILAGRVEAGSLKVGDRLVFSPTNKVSTVKTIERWNAPPSSEAQAGESIGVTLTEQVFVARGAIAALETEPPYELARFKARLFWLGRAPFKPGKSYKLKLATQEMECEIESIQRVIDSSTLEAISRK